MKRTRNWILVGLVLLVDGMSHEVARSATTYPLGDLGKPSDYNTTIRKFRANGDQLSATFDWRTSGVVTSAKDQGNCGSCWAFASVGVLESRILMTRKSNSIDLSEQQILSSDTGSCSGGGKSTALQYWYAQRPMEEYCTGYVASDTPPTNMSQCLTAPYLSSGYYTVDVSSTSQIKNALSSEGPAYFRFDVYDDFFTYWESSGAGTVYKMATGSRQGGHAVLIIGWDDNKQAWLLKNSWGKNAGPNKDGTFWIAYSGHKTSLEFGMSGIKLKLPVQNQASLSLSNADKKFTGEKAGDELGSTVAAGDLNGDGKSDLVMIAPFSDRTNPEGGAAYVFYGPSYGSLSQAQAIILGEKPEDRLYFANAAGDYNGDGKRDLVLGSSWSDANGKDSGAVYVFNSAPSGTKNAGSAAVRITAESPYDGLGAVASAGDEDDDGYGDLLLAAPYNDRGGASAGAIYLFHGNRIHSGSAAEADTIFIGEEYDMATVTTTSCGDLNGDGNSDVVIASAYHDGWGGAVYVFFGPADEGVLELSEADAILYGDSSAGDLAGTSMAVGDLNGDEQADLAIGAPGYDVTADGDEGALFVVYGPVEGEMDLRSSAAVFRGEVAGDNAGHSVSFLGDTNGDGLGDLLISAGAYDQSYPSAGVMYLIMGSSSRYGGAHSLSEARQRILGQTTYDMAGWSTSSADINGDGLSELLIGALSQDSNGANAGTTYLYRLW